MRRRLSLSHLLIGGAVVLAFVLNLIALQDRSASTLVAVAARPVPIGSVLSSDLVRLTPVSTDFEGLDSLITEEELPGLDGWVVARPLQDGEALTSGSLSKPGPRSGLRSMSLPIDITHAAGGSIAPGDRIDVIAVADGVATYVATGLEVSAVAKSASGQFGVSQDYHLVVGVDADQALALAAALAGGGIEIVRSTGAVPVDVEVSGDDG